MALILINGVRIKAMSVPPLASTGWNCDSRRRRGSESLHQAGVVPKRRTLFGFGIIKSYREMPVQVGRVTHGEGITHKLSDADLGDGHAVAKALAWTDAGSSVSRHVPINRKPDRLFIF